MVLVAHPELEIAPARTAVGARVDERAARRALRAQITRLEAELAETVDAAFSQRVRVDPVVGEVSDGPRLLDLGELERGRDALAAKLHELGALLAARGEEQGRAREALERMLLEPRRHKFRRIHRADVGEPGCGEYRVVPRLGLIGMLAGWWHVKLSSGCPRAT
jgi:hypothetical protein